MGLLRLIDRLKDLMRINRYRMYRKDTDGSLYEVGSLTISWWDVRDLKDICKNAVFLKANNL